MIEYLENKQIPADELIPLYDSVGWLVYSRVPEKMAKLLPNSLWYLAAYDDDRLVGLIRAIGDDASIAYIQDILVHPDYQRQGIGRTLVDRALKRFDHLRQLVLITDDLPETKAFYEAVGFQAIAQTGGACFVRYQLDK